MNKSAMIASLFAMLGAPYDAFRPIWARADRDARRLFLKAARFPESWATRDFDELSPETRRELKTRVFALRDWLNKALVNG